MKKRVVFLVPKSGMLIRDPMTGDRLPARGKRVELNSYWSRRIAEGSVTVFEETKNFK